MFINKFDFYRLHLFSGPAGCFLFWVLAFLILQTPAWAEDKSPLSGNRESITLRADGLKLEQVIHTLQDQHPLIFSGISEYMEKEVTLSCTGSVTEVVKQLLKALDIQNYAFTFSGDRLVQVSVFPLASSTRIMPLPREPDDGKKKPAFRESNTVQIQKVLPGTQGERIPLQAGDLIIAYKGHKIENARTLIAYVKRYEQEDGVNMVIVRDKIPMEFILEGGFIGVQVITVPIPSQTLENFYRDSGL